MSTLKFKEGEARQKGEEQRRHPRNNLMLEVEGRTTAQEANETPMGFCGHTTDVSLRGLCISAVRNPGINIGQQLKVMIQLSQDEPPIEAVGQLCWLKEADETKSTQIGLELLWIVNITRGCNRWIERINWNLPSHITCKERLYELSS